MVRCQVVIGTIFLRLKDGTLAIVQAQNMPP